MTGMLVGGCGAPPTPPPGPKQVVPTATVTTTSAAVSARDEKSERVCREARGKLEALSKEDYLLERCGLLAVEQGLSRCESVPEEVSERVTELWRKRRDRGGELTAHGALVKDEAHPDDVRVWEIVDGSPRLRARIERGSVTLLDDGKVAVTTRDGLFLVDVRTGKRAGLQKGWFAAQTPKYLFAGDAQFVHRFNASDLSLAGQVDLGVGDGWPSEAVALDEGKALVIRDTLVRFDPPRIVSRNVTPMSVRADGARLLGCDQGTNQVFEVDAATGTFGPTMQLQGVLCGERGAAVHTTPTYTKDSAYSFWFEPGKETKDAGAEMFLAVGEVATGKVQRAIDPRHTWSIAFASRPYVDAWSGLLCQSLASFHWSWDECTWTVGKGGKPGIVRQGIAWQFGKWGLGGATEIARTVSPSGGRAAFLTHTLSGGVSSDVRVTVVGNDNKVVAKKVLRAGRFTMPKREPEAIQNTDPVGTVAFLGEDHVVALAGEFAVSGAVVLDVKSGVARAVCGDEACSVSGGRLKSEKGLLDPGTGKWLSLTASDAEWAAAASVPAPCDKPP